MKSSPALSRTSESGDRGKNVAREDKAGEEKGRRRTGKEHRLMTFFPKSVRRQDSVFVALCPPKEKILGEAQRGSCHVWCGKVQSETSF